MFKTGIYCEVCGCSTPATPDDGVPVGWFQLTLITKDGGSWDDKDERHFCSKACVRSYGADDYA